MSHPYCLHLWRWQGGAFPTPDALLVAAPGRHQGKHCNASPVGSGKQMTPPRSILDRRFVYRSAAQTDLRATFRRIRREQKALAETQAAEEQADDL